MSRKNKKKLVELLGEEDLGLTFGRELQNNDLEEVTGAGSYGWYGDEYYLRTTVGYGCSQWPPSIYRGWYGAKGACGSCGNWAPPSDGLAGITCYIGARGFCLIQTKGN